MVTMTNWPAHAVVLPGTGSDARFAADAFSAALAAVGTSVHAVDPDPTRVVASYDEALDAAARQYGRIIVGGISIGAAVAAAWSTRNTDRVTAVMAALPPWLGTPDNAPAALSARLTSHRLTTEGLESTTAAMVSSSPPWLAETLGRSWAAQWPDLPAALNEAAAYTALDVAQLRGVRTPTAVIGAIDDAVHPYEVAETWHQEIPRATLSTVRLADIGDDPAVLGRLAVAGLQSLLDQPPSCCIAEPDEPRRGPSAGSGDTGSAC